MEKKIKTMKVAGDADYAKVKDRLKEFREGNPNGKHESAYETHPDGSVVFTVWLWREKQDLLDLMKAGITDGVALRASADANGNAKGEIGKKAKDFEKLETIALGRALANLGYASDGEIASSEEMEKFLEDQEEKKAEALFEVTEAIGNCETLDALKEYWSALSPEMKKLAETAKEARKVQLTEKTKKVIKKKVTKETHENA